MLTDVGLCHVYNGNSISQSFVTVGRNLYLQQSFEQNSGEFHPAKINGTGFQNQETFWFDVGIRYYFLGTWCTNILGDAIVINFNRSWESFTVSQQRRGPATLKGSAKIAINEWLSQFNVRGAQIEAPAGMETRIKISQNKGYGAKIRFFKVFFFLYSLHFLRVVYGQNWCNLHVISFS